MATKLRRVMCKTLIGAGLVLVVQAGPASATQPRVKACMGVDTSAGARNGSNGATRSWLATGGAEIFGVGVSMGDVVQFHKMGYLGGTCGS